MYPFNSPTSIVISGCTGSGKTYWLYRLLQNAREMFPDDPPKEVLYCYGVWQPLFEEMEQKLAFVKFHSGLPAKDQIEELSSNKGHNLLILDDLSQQVSRSEEMELLFTRGVHHKRISVVYLNQNIFYQGKNARTIALNSHYLVLMQNPRDASQIETLGRQIFPSESKAVAIAYRDAVSMPFGYLLIDLSPHAEQNHRLRTLVFPGEETIVYLPVKYREL